jgi:hypothetical protein
MRAKGLWRIAPRPMKTEPERAMAVRPELIPPDLQRKMVVAFERARAERLAAQVPEEAASQVGDPWTRANTAAFLLLESERRAIASRLTRSYRRPRHRYRDLVLVTKLIRLEYEHLAGRVSERAGHPAAPNGLPARGDMPADWARPWGSGPMVEIGTAFTFYRNQRDRLARQLPTRTLKLAAAAAEQHRNRILTRFEGAMGEWSPELERGRVTTADSGKGHARPIPKAAGHQKRAWPWASLRLTRPAAALAAVFAAVGVGTIITETRGGGSPSSVSTASPAVAIVPMPLAKLPREPQPARGRGARHGAPHRSTTPQRNEGQGASHAVLAASEIPPAAAAPEVPPAPIAPAAPVAAPAPVATPAPTPPPHKPPTPKPRPDPKPRPGPVNTLPPPVNTLPPPGGSTGGGG